MAIKNVGIFFFFVSLIVGCGLKTTRQMQTDQGAEAAMALYKQSLPETQACYQPYLAEAPRTTGLLTLEWSIDDKGQVVEPAITEKNFYSQGIETCLFTHLKKIKFAPAPGFSKIKLSYSHRF